MGMLSADSGVATGTGVDAPRTGLDSSELQKRAVRCQTFGLCRDVGICNRPFPQAGILYEWSENRV